MSKHHVRWHKCKSAVWFGWSRITELTKLSNCYTTADKTFEINRLLFVFFYLEAAYMCNQNTHATAQLLGQLHACFRHRPTSVHRPIIVRL